MKEIQLVNFEAILQKIVDMMNKKEESVREIIQLHNRGYYRNNRCFNHRNPFIYDDGKHLKPSISNGDHCCMKVFGIIIFQIEDNKISAIMEISDICFNKRSDICSNKRSSNPYKPEDLINIGLIHSDIYHTYSKIDNIPHRVDTDNSQYYCYCDENRFITNNDKYSNPAYDDHKIFKYYKYRKPAIITFHALKLQEFLNTQRQQLEVSAIVEAKLQEFRETQNTSSLRAELVSIVEDKLQPLLLMVEKIQNLLQYITAAINSH